MLLDDRQRLGGKRLHRFVVALVGIFREQIFSLLMGADLLLGIGLVEIPRMRRVQIVDHALMLVIELAGRSTLIFSACTIPFSSSVVCECASTMCWPNCFTASDSPL